MAGTYVVGGLLGWVREGSVTDCYASASAIKMKLLTTSLSAGRVTLEELSGKGYGQTLRW